ncbi:sperm-associated microtubule inner protein 10 [Ambystoma mexicanum]|uniref:sperm-associated microtubule inner protein 10 n=1 Tax=Ambystoma mexicanum TaxID=8296 RepID=UPI0037E91BD1
MEERNTGIQPPNTCRVAPAARPCTDEHHKSQAPARAPAKVSVATNTIWKGLVHAHFPLMTKSHPMIPKRYVMPWKQDMMNRRLIAKNADLAKLHKGPQEESLFLENRERLCHGEDRERIEEKLRKLPPLQTIDFTMDSPLYRYKSSVLNYHKRSAVVIEN